MNRSLLFITIILLMFFSLTALSQVTTSWQSVYPYPTGNDLYDVHAFDANNIIAIGDGGTLVRSTDGGLTWRANIKIGGKFGGLRSMSFQGSVGIAVGRLGALLKTTNSGFDWQDKSFNDMGQLDGVVYKPDGVAFAVGLYGKIINSTDNGNTWTSQPLFTTRHLRSISFGDLNFGMVVGDSNTIYRTTNGGLSWLQISIGTGPDNPLRKVHCLDSSSAIVVAGSELFRTGNKGDGWAGYNFESGRPSGATIRSISISVLNSATLLVGHGLSGSHYITRSTDYGVTWSWFDFGKDISPNGIAYINANDAIAVGSGGAIFKSSDGGVTWEEKSKGGGDVYHGIDFLDGMRGVAVGSNGRIVKTTDGGENWFALPPGNPPHPWSGDDNGSYHSYSTVKYLNDSTIAVAGGLGAFAITTDTGNSWHNITWNTHAAEIKDMHFLDRQKIIAVGTYGSFPNTTVRIIKSTDGGTTWNGISHAYESTSGWLYDVFFIDSLNGYTVGDVGSYPTFSPILLRTTDAGNSWIDNSANLPSQGSMKGLHFLDSSNGWLVGMTGTYPTAIPTVLQTTNGGTSWLSKSLPYFNSALNRVKFINSTTGFAVGFSRRDPVQSTVNDVPAGYPALYYTTNGGNTWLIQSVASSYLKEIAFVERNGHQLGFSAGSGIFCSVVLPLNIKLWVGDVDSSWSNADNWDPVGIPSKVDSVVIQPAGTNPVIDIPMDQVIIGSLYVRGGGRLSISSGVSSVIVKGDVTVNGTLKVATDAMPNFIVGGSWKGNKVSLQKASVLDEGFVPGNSTVVLNGKGETFGKFYTLIVDSSADVQSSGNITIQNRIAIIKALSLRPEDTLEVENTEAQALAGEGYIVNGTIRRALATASTETYNFESEKTYLKFNGTGTYPSKIAVTTRAKETPRAFSLRWKTVTNSVRSVEQNTVTGQDILPETKWALGIPKLTLKNSSLVSAEGIPRVARMLSIEKSGTSNAKAELSMRYDESELDNPLVEDSLVLLQGPYVAKMVKDKWNLVSLPVATAKAQKDSVFPTAVSSAFAFNNGYVEQTSLAPGGGYWLKFSGEQEAEVMGYDKEYLSIPVTAGWNIVGALSYELQADAVTSSPSDIIESNFFAYDNGYATTTALKPMEGHWVKVSQEGELRFDVNAFAKTTKFREARAVLENEMNVLTVSDAEGSKQNLYFGTSAKLTAKTLALYQMPPAPPQGVFDARFSNQRIVATPETEKESVTKILLTSERYPVTLKWEGTHSSSSTILTIDGKKIILNGKGSHVLYEPAGSIELRMPPVQERTLPQEFTLEQNYPNPFNPATTINYALPADAKVTLKIYNTLGQLVATLVDEVQEAGYQSKLWDASNVGTGVYFYRLEAASVGATEKSFTQHKKMLLVK
ncbi:MAG: T9SS type A sorting domain-containing protein [Ignavibacteriae bacterium]|nr:T9SS type A sorting domain-containing protein [Ignavibacteriota bacterium]